MDQDDSSQEPLVATTSADDRYVVVARRYRPQSFDELVGQQHVRKALANAIESNRVGHAYLFAGPRGTGKTTTARIFAKALNCQSGPTIEPCKQCDICQAIAEGLDVDVIEIDGASNNSVENVRSLRENCTVRPSRSRFKVYIIDEVHMLSRAAFNALLKTLEEPPEHVKFMFCTTDPDKLPITILSRCQRFDLSPVDDEKIVERLKFILSQENRVAEDAAVTMLARRAYGSLRDSQSLLEQLLSYSAREITVDDVHHLLGTSDSGKILDLLEALACRSASNALGILAEFWKTGSEPERLSEQILGVYRDLLSASVGCQADMMQYTQLNEFNRVEQLAANLGKQTLLASLEIMQEMLRRVRNTTKVRILVETAIVRLASLEELDRIEQWLNVLQSPEMKEFANSNLVIVPGGISSQQVSATQKKNDLTEPANPWPVDTPQPQSNQVSHADGPTDAVGPAAIDSGVEQNTPEPNLKPSADNGLDNPANNNNKVVEQVASPADAAQRVEPTSLPPRSVENNPAAPVDSGTQATIQPEHTFNVTNENVLAVWERVCQNLDDLTASTLQSAQSVAISVPNHLVVKFPSHYTFQKDACERPERRVKLEDELYRLTGNRFRVTFELLPESVQSQPVVQEGGVKTTRQRRREAEQHPMVQQAAETFGAEVVRVDQTRRRQ